MCCKSESFRWRNACTSACMEPVTCAQHVRLAILARSHEIVDQALLEIWRRPGLFYMRRVAEWELRAWLLGILRRVGDSDPSLGFLHFSRPFLWHEAVETVRILMRRTSIALGGDPDMEADLRRFFNQYLIRLGEHYESRPPKPDPRAVCAISQMDDVAESGKT
jgi:hypothetical protein